MKRSFGIGDILIAAGLLLMLTFLIISFATYSGKGGGGGMAGAMFGSGMMGDMGAKWEFGWGSVTSIILWLVMLGAGFLLLLSLLKGDVKILNVHYALAGFMVLLHLPIQVSSYAGIGSPQSFYIFLGALLVGVGTYLTQQGTMALFGGGAKPAKKKKD